MGFRYNFGVDDTSGVDFNPYGNKYVFYSLYLYKREEDVKFQGAALFITIWLVICGSQCPECNSLNEVSRGSLNKVSGSQGLALNG